MTSRIKGLLTDSTSLLTLSMQKYLLLDNIKDTHAPSQVPELVLF